MAFESGKERIGVCSRIESYGFEGFWIPDQVMIHTHVIKRGSELKNVGRKSCGGGVPMGIGEIDNCFGPQIEGAGYLFDRHGFTAAGTEVIEIGNGNFGEFDKVAIGHALGFLSLEQDVEVGVFEIHERRRAVWRAASVAGTGVSVRVEGGEGSSNQERQPERVGELGRFQVGEREKGWIRAKWRSFSSRESKCSRMVLGS